VRKFGKRGLLRTTVLAGFAAAAATVSPALAQTPDDEEAGTQDRIIVTGSRIERTDLNGPSPIQVFDESLIDARGISNTQDLLFSTSVAGPGLFNEAATLSQAAGVATFDARGFGSGSTLVLINGRRVPTIPLGGSAASDINSLPFAAIERVEFLLEGASAVYGSDAIGGVVNIITKTDFEGLNITTRFGDTETADGESFQFSIVGGTTTDRASATFSLEYTERDSIAAGERPLIRSASAPDGTDGRSPTGFPGTWVNFDANESIPFADCPAENIRPAQFTANGFDCAYDFAPLYQVMPQTNSWKSNAYFTYDILPNLEFFADLRLARTVTEVRNGAAPANFFVDPGVQGNPFPTASFALRRAVDAGPRSRDATNWTLSAALGANWDFHEDHSLSAYYQRSHVDLLQLGTAGNISDTLLTAAVLDGSFSLANANPADVIASISIPTHRQSYQDEEILSASLSGFLPFGEEVFADRVGYAVGAEYRDSTYTDTVDVAQLNGDIAGGAASNGAGGRDNFAAFAEVSVVPIDMLEITGALRYDEFENITGESADDVTYKLGAALTPRPWLTLRASTGTGFRAPSLGQLYLAQSFGVSRAVDTTVCEAAEATPDPADDANACRTLEIRSVSGGNPDLKPEESESYNLGAIMEFDEVGFLQDVRIQLDWSNTEVTGKIGSLGVQEILNNESLYPELVNRVSGRLSSPDAFVRSNLQNLSVEEGEFLDFVFTGSLDAGDIGEFNADVRISHLLSFERQSSAIQPLCEDAGTTSEPEWRSNVTVGWLRGPVGANLSGRYIGETEDIVGGRVNGGCEAQTRLRPVDDYWEFALNGHWDFNDASRVTVGVTNLFDEEPPFSEVAGGGWPFYDQALYSNIGRAWYLQLSADF